MQTHISWFVHPSDCGLTHTNFALPLVVAVVVVLVVVTVVME